MMYKIKHKTYRCHPETCCCKNHHPWAVYNHNNEIRASGEKSEMIKYCNDRNLTYRIEELTWNDVL